MKEIERDLIWINDKAGRDYLCTLDSNRAMPVKFEELSPQERVTCRNVEEVLAVEWW